MNFAQLTPILQRHPYPLVFATISGAHLYGFASPDSDYDVRGVHVLPLERVLGLNVADETVQIQHDPTLDLDLVTHDIKKFISLMLKRNGYVLEQLFSPLILHTTPEHTELKKLAEGCITRHHWHHYAGFAHTQWNLWQKHEPRQIKPLLYIYRVLLTGIYLMQTGIVEANLVTLNQHFKLTYLDDLIAQKTTGNEHGTLDMIDEAFHQREYQRLLGELEHVGTISTLPNEPTTRSALNDLLVKIRLHATLSVSN